MDKLVAAFWFSCTCPAEAKKRHDIAAAAFSQKKAVSHAAFPFGILRQLSFFPELWIYSTPKRI